MIVAAEAGAGVYFFGKNPPAGPGWGGRVDIPILWGFGAAVGYQGVKVVGSSTFPVVTHHPYVALIYRVDDLPLVIPWGELGAGLLFMVPTDRPSITMLETGHFGGGIDFKLGPVVVGATVRYHIYLQTLTVPGAVAFGVRVGLRFWE
jgi:hypothetical protein